MSFNVLLAGFYAKVKPDLDSVNRFLNHKLEQTQLMALRDVNRYLLDSPGKRLRPLFASLCFRHATQCASLPHSLVQFGAALELIHMASLIHDDIIDEAEKRHNVPTIHKKWGIGVAIPVGVYYYAQSLNVLTDIHSMPLIRSVSHAVKQLCEGELDQVFERYNAELSVKQHLIMLRKKTAALFEVAGYGAGLLSEVPKQQAQVYKSLGYCLGLMFQISDDHLDIMDREGQLSKSLGQDLQQGDMTLPIICSLKSVSKQEADHLMQRIKDKDDSVMDTIRDLCRSREVKNQIEDLFGHYKNRYEQLRRSIDSNNDTDSFKTILTLIESRMN